jgi:cyclic pyranopterin phosphate synthase
MTMLTDSYKRQITNIRISLTQRCNLNCIYCHKEGHIGESDRELSPIEIERVMRVAASLGVNRVKLTGGEPTLREDLVEIVEGIASIPSIEEISMTTNGILLENLASRLKEAGLNRVNVTIDSLKHSVYSRITGHDSLDSALRGMKSAVSAGLTPVKINFVVLKSVNDSEVQDLIRFSSETGAILQLIELVSKDDNNEFYQKYHYDLRTIEDQLRKDATRIVGRVMNKRKKYLLSNGAEVEIVKPMHNTEFCSNCHRIRLTSDGKLKPCLMREGNLVDILNPIRQCATDSGLAELICQAVRLREPFYKKSSSTQTF